MTLMNLNQISISKVLFSLLFCMILSSALLAEDKIKLIALFKDKAMVIINGKQVLLHKGEKNRYKILLLSANSDKAVIRINDEDRTFKLNMLISTNYSKRDQVEVTLWANNQNMFSSNGKINGKNVHFLIDTGATAIAMNENHAKKLGVNYRNAQKGFAQTASGVVNTWMVKLNTVELGDIKLRNVGAMIIQGTSSKQILLGMTFLSQIKMTRNGQKMRLLKKH
jgi:aspartyl protease family protein